MTSTLPTVELEDIPPPSGTRGSSHTVQFGRPIPPQQQLLLYSSADWEEFIHEWVHAQRSKYVQVLRFSGSGDMGIDVAGFADAKQLLGVWDNFQCKHYGNPLTPAQGAAEIAKVLWHSFCGRYTAPRSYYFIAPRECGPGLRKLLANASELRAHVVKNWAKQCADAITGVATVALDGPFRAYVDAFDFSIFKQRTLLDVLDEHRTSTPYYAARFGGGLPVRPTVAAAPYQEGEAASRYIQQLFEAYGDHAKRDVVDLECLADRADLVGHFHRQREFFYHAEALRNFARDTLPRGTFEELQAEVHAGVIDVEAAVHPDGYVRMNAVTQAATVLELTANPLISVVKVQDRKGMCHQLANEDRLRWRKP